MVNPFNVLYNRSKAMRTHARASARTKGQRKTWLQKAGTKQPGRGSGRPFQPGESGNPAGKVKGTLNTATLEIRLAARQIVEDPVYREKLIAAARERKLAPAVECLLLYYAYGKPKEVVDVSVSVQGAADVLADTLTLNELKTLRGFVGRIEAAQLSGS